MAMPVVSEMPPVSPSPARTSSRAGTSPTAGAKVEYRERERRRSSRGATERDGSTIKEEPQASLRVKQEPLDDPVVAYVKQELPDDPDEEDDLRAKWEAELDVKEEEINFEELKPTRQPYRRVGGMRRPSLPPAARVLMADS